jgi:hypothetical protein
MKKTLSIIIAVSFSTSVLASKPAQTHHIKWNEDSGKIIHSTVCYNYKPGSIDYRRCRSQAKKHFKAQCKYYKSNSSDSKDSRVKFCSAANSFNPIVS